MTIHELSGTALTMHPTELINIAEHPRCDRCGIVYAAAGDGWDGKCPECADLAEKQRECEEETTC